MTIPSFQKHILAWYKTNRRPMPWRNTKNPYRIMVSEVMLQQTQISRVIPKYKEFLAAFPTLESLARAKQAKLLKTWQGLGYWKRALNLQKSARQILATPSLFRTPPSLETLPGIGHYTARAIACFAFQNPEAFLDTNIRRVYIHFFFPSTRFARSGQVPRKISDKEILPIAQKAVWKENPREWHYALFDYGATVLKNKTINKQSSHYHKQSTFTGSLRSFRTRVVKLLLDEPSHRMTKTKLLSWLETELQKQNRLYSAGQIIDSLLKDNLLKQTPRFYSV